MLRKHHIRNLLLMLVVFSLTAGAAAFLAHSREQSSLEAQEKTLAAAAASIQQRLNSELDLETNALLRLAGKWSLRPSQDRLGWDLDVQQVLSSHPSLLAIAWVEFQPNAAAQQSSFPILWTHPALYEHSVRRLHSLIERNRPGLLRDVFTHQRLEVSEAIHVADRNKAFAAYAPSLRDGKVQGAVLGVFHLQILLDSTFEKLLPRQYSLQLLDGSAPIYERGEPKADPAAWEHRHVLTVFGSRWLLRLWPTGDAADSAHRESRLIFWIGLTLASVLSALVWLLPQSFRTRPAPLPALPLEEERDPNLELYQSALSLLEEPLLLLEQEDQQEKSGGASDAWIRLSNQSLAQLTGLQLSEIAGKTLRTLLTQFERDFADADSLSSHALLTRKGQSPLPVHLQARRLGNTPTGSRWLCLLSPTTPPLAAPSLPPNMSPDMALVAHAPVAALLLDSAGQVKQVNPLAESLLGATSSDLLSQAPPFALPSRFLEQRQPFTIHTENKAGTRLILQVWSATLPSGTLLYLADYTQVQLSLEDLQQRELLYRTLVESSSTILALLDEHSRIRYINPAVETELGLDPAHLVGSTAADLFPTLSTHSEQPSQVTVPHADGSPRELETILHLLADGSGSVLNAHPVSSAAFLQSVPEAILRFDLAQRLTWLNHAAEDLYGLSAQQAIGKSLSELLPTWLQVPSRDRIFAALESQGVWKGEISNYTPQGREIVQEASFTYTCQADAQPTGVVAILRDITEKKHAIETFSAGQAAQTLNALGSGDGLWDWNLRTDELYLSPHWKEMLGYPEDALGSRPADFFDIVHPDDLPLLRSRIQQHLDGHSEFLEAEYRARTAAGDYRWMLTRALATRNAASVPTRLVGLQTDIQQQKESDEQLLFEAFHDSTTGLANRALFLDRLHGLLSHEPTPLAVLFADIAAFAQINETLGPRGGDRALAEVARRLGATLPPGSILARHGSDEFVALLPTSDPAQLANLADRIHYELAKPFLYQKKSVSFRLHLGFALAAPGLSAEDLLSRSSRAMAQARASSQPFLLFQEASATHSDAPLSQELLHGLASGAFRVFYHPIITLDTGEIAGLESLVRWQHPTRGLLTPQDFLPAAESSGAVVELDRWVLREACAKAAELNQRFRRVETLVLTVNLSGRHFTDPALTNRLAEILNASGINPRYLRLELKEAALAEAASSPALRENLRRLRVQLSLDDFAGPSPLLASLDALPVDRIKLDAALIGGLSSGRSLDRVRALIEVAESHHLQVVAEGVETLEQLAVLRELKCHLAQGFYFTRPASASDTERLLARSPRW